MRAGVYDAIVIGAGGMGSAVTYHLAQAGAKTLALEQFQVGHTFGSSHGETRIIRLLYDKTFYIRLMQAAYTEWQSLQRLAGKQLLYVTGSVSFSHDGQHERSMRAALDAVGVASEWWDAAQLQQRFPPLRVPKATQFLWQKDTGFLHASACIDTHLQLAAQHQATIYPQSRVTSINWQDDLPSVTTPEGHFYGKKIIVTAGAWTGTLLAELHLPLTVTEQQVCYYQPQAAELFHYQHFPVFSEATADGGFFYGIPAFGAFAAGRGVKVGYHSTGKPLAGDETPESRVRRPDRAFTNRLDSYLHTRLPALGQAQHAETCLYTETPDKDFIIDTHPHCPNLLFAAGFSGHGFKFCALVGRIMTELALNGATELDISPLRLARPSLGGVTHNSS